MEVVPFFEWSQKEYSFSPKYCEFDRYQYG